MGKNLDKVLRIAEKVSEIAEVRIRKELNALAKSGLVSRKEAKQLLKAALKEAEKERHRVRKFIEAELKRELRKAKPLVKKALAKKKKQFSEYRKKRKR
jgi:Asp-tRNA(Asn)/Glu-tRNA(Gln) amidotransferase B subunit